MNITRLAIDNDRVTLTLLAVILFAGVSAYLKLPRAEDPGFIIRAAQVLTYFPGAGPQRVEELVTDPLEKVIQEIPELDFISSQSKAGVSVIVVNIRESFTEMRPIWDNLRRKVERARADLPPGVVGPNVNDEFGDLFGVVITLRGEGFSYAEMADIADEVRDELLRNEEVAKVDVYGKQAERVFVEYNNARLAELGLSPQQLVALLQAQNIIIPGGELLAGRERIALEPSGSFESVADLGSSILKVPGRAELIYLRDVAAIRRSFIDPPQSLVRANADPALTIAVSMREGGNIIRLGEQIEATLQRLQAVYPWGVEFGISVFQPEAVDRKVRDFSANLLQAIAVVSLVMLVTLGLRTGLVVASLIPSAIVMALLAMSVFGIGLNQVSLAALIIALGMLVDNAIVMAESTLVQMQAGKDAVAAAVDSANELKVPLLTSSLTTGAAFLPIYLAESSTGEYTAALFEVVTITLLCSWVLAITVVPLLCVRFLRVSPREESFDGGTYRAYRAVLRFVLRNRLLSVSVVGALFAAAIYGLGSVPKLFFPPSDRAFFKAEVELPVGSDIRATEALVIDIERFLVRELQVGQTRPAGVRDWVVYIGNGGPRFVLQHNPEPASPHYALFVINVTDYRDIEGIMARIEDYVFANHPSATSNLKRFDNGPPVTNPVEVRVLGREEGTLFELVEQVKAQLADIPGTRNVRDDWGLRTKKLRVNINQARAQRAGLSSQDIAVSLQTGLSGIEMTEYREGADRIPIVMRSVAADRQDIGKLESLNVFSQLTGTSVPLKQVADVEVVWQSANIRRRDRFKAVNISAALRGEATAAEVFAQLAPWLEAQRDTWPVGYRYEFGGEAETSGKANQSIAEKLPIAALIIILLLVGQFNSVRRPLIILLTIPLGMIGVTAGLIVLDSYMGFMTFLGIISLAGIVINNAIVLLERIRTEIDETGLPPFEAIIEAAQRRLRPILLTTATTVFGLLPLYFGGGAMWEPMAIAIMSGLVFATVLTLGFVPVMYSLLFRVRPGGPVA